MPGVAKGAGMTRGSSLIAHSDSSGTVTERRRGWRPDGGEEMTDMRNNQIKINEASTDVFAAARWLESLEQQR
jgi:hypothetical protein